MEAQMKITSLKQLDALVAEKVAGLRKGVERDGEWYLENGLGIRLPPYSTSADAVLPLLDKVMWMAERTPPAWCHVAFYGYTPAVHAEAPTFPLAACLALLRSRGIKVELDLP